METLIIIPARNEEKTVGQVVEKVFSFGFTDVMVVNDASADNTGQIAEQSGAKVIQLPIPLGAWGAIQTGFRYALEKGYNRVVTMDADGQHEAFYISDLVRSLKDNEVVIGAFTDRHRYNPFKNLLVKIFKIISGLHVNDVTSGFRAYSSKAIEVLVGFESLVLEYQDIGVLMLLKDNNIHIRELPVSMEKREHGTSKVFKNFISIIQYTLSTLFLIGAKR